MMQFFQLVLRVLMIRTLVSHTSARNLSCIALRDLRIPVFPDLQLHQFRRLLDGETLLIGQMQQADEAITGRDVVHHRPWIDLLEIVHDFGELECRVVVRRW